MDSRKLSRVERRRDDARVNDRRISNGYARTGSFSCYNPLMAITTELFNTIEEYLSLNFEPVAAEATVPVESYTVDQPTELFRRSFALESFRQKKSLRSLDELDSRLQETFSQHLMRLIREQGLDEVAVYRKAGIDRRHFSKIRSNDDYKPSKATAVAFALALELNLDDTLDLLGRAGFTLSHSSRSDLIIEYFIVNENRDIFEINEALDAFNEPVLKN